METELSNKTVGKTKTLQLVSKECSSMTVGRYKNGDEESRIKQLQGSDTTRNRKLNFKRLTSKSEVKLMRNVSRYKNGDT